MKFVQRFRTVVLFAHNLGLINFNPFGAYKLKFEYVERGYLEQDELARQQDSLEDRITSD